MDTLIPEPIAFEWDKGNKDKNWIKHNISNKEAEQVFKNIPIFYEGDFKHSHFEKRYMCLGKTDKNRKLFISFTIRKQKIRIISARDQSKKEREFFKNL